MSLNKLLSVSEVALIVAAIPTLLLAGPSWATLYVVIAILLELQMEEDKK